MSDTPRTDKQAGYPDGSGCWKYTELGLYVDADFARQLERENARLRSELEAKMEDGKGHSRLRNKTRTNT